MALHEAASAGDYGAVQRLLRRRTNLNARDVDSRTPLHLATQAGHVTVVKLLLSEEGLDPDPKDDTDTTPLSWAAQKGYKEITKLFLNKSGIDVNSKDNTDTTPLFWAAQNGHKDVVELFLHVDGIDLNSRNRHGGTPLSVAAELGYDEIVELFLTKEGVNINSRSNRGFTPLSWAAQNGHKEVAKLLLKKEDVDLNSKDNTDTTPLSWAAKNGHKDVVELLVIQEGVDPDSKDNTDTTPLSWAAQNGHKDVVELFLHVDGIDLNSRNRHGGTPLSLAAELGYKEIVELLLNREGVNVNCTNKRGATPLSWAAQNGHKEVVKLLLKKEDVDVDWKDNTDTTPLCLAAENGHNEVVELLVIQEGVDPDSKDNTDTTPLSWAARNGHKDVVEVLLQQEGVDVDSRDNEGLTPLSRASRYGHAGVVALLIEKGGKADSEDKNGYTPLQWATENSQSQVVRLLLEQRGDTLHTLVQRGERTYVRSLLSKSNVHSRDPLDQTPLHVAVIFGHLEIAKDIISSGADINTEDGLGRSPLRLAINQMCTDFIYLLLQHSATPRGIEAHEWLTCFGSQGSAIIQLTETGISIINGSRIEEPLPLWGPERFIMIFHPESKLPWREGWLRNVAVKLKASHDKSPQGVRYFVTASLPTSVAFYDGKDSLSPIGISWTMKPPVTSNGELSWKSIAHLSVLPAGWIPENGTELFELFMSELEKRWSALCDETKSYLHEYRFHQLEKKGKTSELIDRLAGLAKNLAECRSYLQDQSHEAKAFSDDYRRRHNEVGVSGRGHVAMNSCFENTTKRFDDLDQTVRDLLQFACCPALLVKVPEANDMQEFAWVSINESFKSTSTAASAKRLSWVTFIFLPAMFASSLFGMNVNILKDNPDWRSYIPVLGASLTLTIVVWLIFKYNPIEARIEKFATAVSQKWKGQHEVQHLQVHNKTEDIWETQRDDVNSFGTSPV